MRQTSYKKYKTTNKKITKMVMLKGGIKWWY